MFSCKFLRLSLINANHREQGSYIQSTMKISTFCKCVLVVVCMLLSPGLKAQEVKLTINATPWDLYNQLGSQRDVVTDLTLTGQINAADIGTIRDLPKLTKLNLAGVSLVAGGTFKVSMNLDISVVNNQVPDYMFFGMANLISVTLPNNVTSIGEQVFQDCTSLTQVVIPSTVKSIGIYSFGNCTSLPSVSLPSAITTLSDYLFWSCKGMTTVTIPSNLTSIGKGTFSVCTGLTQFVVPDANTVYSAIDGVLFNKAKTTLLTYPNSKSAVYTVPDGTTAIDSYAFESCSGLSSVTLPNSVTSLGEGAFYNCTALSNVNLGNSITSVGTNAFYNCNILPSIKIPNSVTSIGWNAFGVCRGLSSIDMGTGVTSIALYAFTYCTGLSTITIPASVTTIDEWAFSYCTGLVGIHCNAKTPPTTSSTAFSGVDKTTCKLYVPTGTSVKYKSATAWKDFKYINEEAVGISEIEASNIKIYTEQDAIIIDGADVGDEVAVYNVVGALLQKVKVTDNVTRIYVPKNQIYLIKITTKTFKVAL